MHMFITRPNVIAVLPFQNHFLSVYISLFSGYTNSIKTQEETMKATDKDKSIRPAPEGAWESGIINERKKPCKRQHLNEITTDSQGNGYPIFRNRQDN